MKKQEELYSFPQQNDGAVVETDIRMIPLSELHDFNGHPFKVENDMALFGLMQSIEKEGVIVPALARLKEDGGYELIAGHRRKAACKWAGLNCMPVVVRDLDDNQAVIAMVDSNLQREHLKPSEKALAYKMKLEAIKRQGARTDLTFCQVGEKITSSQVGKKLSSSQIVTGTSDQVGPKLENPTLQTHSLTSGHDADAGYGYSVIADKLGISVDTVKTHCKRHGLSSKEIDKSRLGMQAADLHYCQECGEVVMQPPKRKFKKFCSDKCRMKWWNTHQFLIKKEANYYIVCKNCGKQFVSYGNKERKYCCHTCYIQDRFEK